MGDQRGIIMWRWYSACLAEIDVYSMIRNVLQASHHSRGDDNATWRFMLFLSC